MHKAGRICTYVDMCGYASVGLLLRNTLMLGEHKISLVLSPGDKVRQVHESAMASTLTLDRWAPSIQRPAEMDEPPVGGRKVSSLVPFTT